MFATTSGYLHGFWGFELRPSNLAASTFSTESSCRFVLNSVTFLRAAGFLRQEERERECREKYWEQRTESKAAQGLYESSENAALKRKGNASSF